MIRLQGSAHLVLPAAVSSMISINPSAEHASEPAHTKFIDKESVQCFTDLSPITRTLILSVHSI